MKNTHRPKRILFAGGGTLGSVSPLLAVVPLLHEQNADIRWIGTRRGPERHLVEEANIPFSWITSTKLHRFITPRLLVQPFALLIAIAQAKWQLLRWRPDVIVSAGGFTAVPLVWVAWFWRIPAVIHQQDLRPTLSNKLMAPFVRRITVAFEESLQHFGNKAEWIGNPVRDLTPTTADLVLDKQYPTVLITGGGTGAQAINELVSAKLCEFANVIHLTGRGREGVMESIQHERYYRFEFLGEEMKEALEKANVVVARAGLGTISELAALGKASIVIPMPQTHQEENAQMLTARGAAIVLDQRKINKQQFAEAVRELCEKSTERAQLESAIHAIHKENAVELFAKTILLQ